MRHRHLLAKALVVLGVVVTQAAGSPALAADAVTKRFDYSGHKEAFVVPAGVTSLFVAVFGASGGSGYGGFPGPGGHATGILGMLPVTPGDTWEIGVGSAGANATGPGSDCPGGEQGDVSHGGSAPAGTGR